MCKNFNTYLITCHLTYSTEFVVTGGQDGKIVVYDAQLRSKEPVQTFDIGQNMVRIIFLDGINNFLGFSTKLVGNGCPFLLRSLVLR